MKTASQESGASITEEKLQSYESYKTMDLPCSVGITLVQDIPLPSEPPDPVKKEDKEGEAPAQILAWLADAHKHLAPKFGAMDIKELEGILSMYLTKVSSCISKCYVPNRAAKMKRCIGDILLFFNIHYREVPETKKTFSSYLDKMTELMAYYIDMEIQASSRAKEAPQAIASRLTLSLFTFLDKSHDHILDSILKANNMNRNFWELCSLLFSGVLKDPPNRILDDLTYVRYILVYKMWKRVVQGPEERKKVMTLASLRLKHPPQFVEKIRAGFLNGIIPKIPKKRPDVTTFLIQAKFDVKEKAKAFLKYLVESKTNIMFVPTVPAIKTDIPLLVGHLPDFGPSPHLVKLEPPEIEDDDSQDVDMSGSRLINEVWTSVNHEASFREAIRMQNVTTFSRSEAKLAEKKKMLRVLKQRKGAPKNLLVSKTVPNVSKEKPQRNVPDKSFDATCTTIVVSDDSDKDGDVEKGVGNRLESFKKSKKDAPIICSGGSKKPGNRASPRDPTPVPESPKSPDRPSPNVCILEPSQIKQEVRDDTLAKGDVVDLPQISGDREETPLDSQLPCTKAETEAAPCSLVDEKTDRAEVSSLTVCDFKEERQSPTIENELNIRINRNLVDQISITGDCQNGSGDTAIKPAESPEMEADTSRGTAQPGNSPEKKRRDDSTLFDDEESSWSPSGGSQEFIRRVVTDFISTYSPEDEDNRPVDSNAPPDNSKNQVVDDDFDLDDLGYGEKPPFESVPGPVGGSPPAKRCRVEEAVEEPQRQTATGSTTHTSPARGDAMQALTVQSNEPVSSSAEEAPPDYATTPKYSIHNITLRYHHNCYLEQATFRDLCTSYAVKPEDEVPSAFFKDPVTDRLTQGCGCSQCTDNFTALSANFKSLVEFKKQVLHILENVAASAADSPAIAEDLNRFEEEQDGSVGQDENMDEFIPGGEASCQLPFKKRKAISGRDDGESQHSQHSDASKEETETRQWPVGDYPSHTPTRMFSIAALEDVALDQAPLSGSCMFENAKPQSSASTSVITNTDDFAFSEGFLPSSQSTGGGFPPFSSVVPPETRSQFYDEVETPAQPAYSQNDDLGRRTFRTPAEMKASFSSGQVVVQSPWSQDLVNVAYFTRNLTSSSDLSPESKRSSRKHSRKNKTKRQKK